MSPSILIVDDSATTRAVLKRTILLAGFESARFLEAEDGAAALALVAAQPVDLILADLNMPRMHGAEMLRRLQEQKETGIIPVVLITAEPNADRIAQLQRQGARACIRKPFTPEAIRDAITDILGVAHA